MKNEETAREKHHDDLNPEKRKITKRQAAYLAERSGLSPDELLRHNLGELHEKLKWHLDWELLFYRRVCGRVVKKDPITGELYPVPNATVHVEDTDCSFLGFFPTPGPWFWLFPFHCRREEIATVTTDECGRFCVYIPRWDIDRILRFRRKRVCWLDLYKPTIRDILERIRVLPDPPVLRKPRPQPDPPPFRLTEPGAIARVREVLGPRAADPLLRQLGGTAFGASIEQLHGALDAPAFAEPTPPPLPPDLHRDEDSEQAESLKRHADGAGDVVRAVDFSYYVGPFLRCRDVWVPVFDTVLDVPDVTFRVTQDVDGDGNEEIIYTEGFFDVRWNASTIPDVTLVASGSALASPACDAPDIDPEQCEKPTIVTAGLMALQPAYHDAASGYARRPNRPRPGGFSDSLKAPIGGPPVAKIPYLGTLQLHGCHRFEGAQFYRLVYAYEAASDVPFTGLSWYAPRLGPGAPLLVSPDADGWYPILNASDLVFPHWLLNWNTRAFPNGLYTVRLQLGDGSKSVIDTSDPVGFRIDNSSPQALFTQIRWRAPGVTGWQALPDVCPVLKRPSGADIELEVTYAASAAHFRDVVVTAHGCGSGGVQRQGDMTVPADRARFEHWHTSPADNAWSNTAVFVLPSTSADGAYTIRLLARSRAFNPAGSDGGPGSDWDYDPVYAYSYPGRSICVITKVP